MSTMQGSKSDSFQASKEILSVIIQRECAEYENTRVTFSLFYRYLIFTVNYISLLGESEKNRFKNSSGST